MLKSYNWDLVGWGCMYLNAPLLLAPLCGANNYNGNNLYFEFQKSFLSFAFEAIEDDDQSVNIWGESCYFHPSHGRQHGGHNPQASQNIFAGKKCCSSRWVNPDARMHRVRGAGQPEVWWVRQCLLLLRSSPGDRHNIDNLHTFEKLFLWRRSTGRHTSLLAHPARPWRVRYHPKRYLRIFGQFWIFGWIKNVPKSKFLANWCKSSGLVQELGNYLVAGRDLAPGSLLLDEEVSVLGPAEQVRVEHGVQNTLLQAGFTNLPWLLLSCPWLYLQVVKIFTKFI